MISVARATGQSVRAVARESYALTLWTYLQVAELDEIARVHREGERIDLAGLVGMAMLDGKQLEQRAQIWRAAAHVQFEVPVQDALARGRRMIDHISKHGVLDG